MYRKFASVVVGVVLLTLCSGASCRQETAQNVLATFLTTLAEAAAEQIVSSATKPLQNADAMVRVTETMQ